MSTSYPHSVSGWGQGRSRRHGSDHNSRSYPHNRNPSVASSTIEVPAPHRNTNYTPNLDPNLKPTSSDNNDNISVARHLGKTLKPSHLQSQSHTQSQPQPQSTQAAAGQQAPAQRQSRAGKHEQNQQPYRHQSPGASVKSIVPAPALRQGGSGSEGGQRQMHVQGCRVDERVCSLRLVLSVPFQLTAISSPPTSFDSAGQHLPPSVPSCISYLAGFFSSAIVPLFLARAIPHHFRTIHLHARF
ncbi:hypothetical protein BU17DRAFT_93830 [Hysterangium stoloniferum]|nr:hypothetical protein BU17DRAFT_93830 [Hysterangium stoloniferum]